MSKRYLFTNFGDLYRAAYAELDPNTKQLLLAEVKKALDRWEQAMRDGVASSADIEAQRGAPIRQAA
jgi:hypothetical protein